MHINQILGAALFAVGVALLVFAYRASNASLERISDTLTGHYSDQTMWYLILGVGGVISGGLLFALGGKAVLHGIALASRIGARGKPPDFWFSSNCQRRTAAHFAGLPSNLPVDPV